MPAPITAYAQNSQYSLGQDNGLPEVNVTGGISDSGTGTFGNLDPSSMSDYQPELGGFTIDQPSMTSDVSSALDAVSSGSGLSSILNSLGLTSNNLGALAPELAVAGVGLAQAKSAQSDASKRAASLAGPSNNLIQAGNQQLQQFQSGKLTPQQQQFVDFTTAEGQAIIDSGQGLKAIATQAFGDYQAGKLPQADEIQLQQQVAAQKQQVASQLGAAGMQDSSVLDAYNQQIDNQAMITRQQLLDARFKTGSDAYNQWLNSTVQGFQVKQAGAQFAQTAFQDMMQNALGLESQGMAGLTQSIALTIQSDEQLSKDVSTLMGNLAAAYAYTVAGGRNGGVAGAGNGVAGGGSGSNLLSQLTSWAKTGANLASDATNIFGDASSVASDASSAADVGDALSGFSSAGGQAATVGAGSLVPDAMGNFSFAPDLASASISDVSMSSDVTDALSQTGGSTVAGGASSGIGLGNVLGAAGAGLSIYNEIENWQPGKTGMDALGGAESGAAVGTAIMPGIGTAIGAVGGAIAGAISSLFGESVDPENANFNQYTQAYNNAPSNLKSQVAASVKNPYVALAGYMDLHPDQMKGQNPIYAKYGRMGEQAFTNDLIHKVQSDKQSGKDVNQAWSDVQNWIASMGTWQDSNKDAMTALIQNMTGQIYAGSYAQNFRAIGGDAPFGSSAPSVRFSTSGRNWSDRRL